MCKKKNVGGALSRQSHFIECCSFRTHSQRALYQLKPKTDIYLLTTNIWRGLPARRNNRLAFLVAILLRCTHTLVFYIYNRDEKKEKRKPTKLSKCQGTVVKKHPQNINFTPASFQVNTTTSQALNALSKQNLY